MYNSVLYVRAVCKERSIPVSRLEKDCGFSNGYLNPRKISRLPYDRARKIAEYLDISVDVILNGEGYRYTVTREEIMYALFRGNRDVTEEMFEEVLHFADYVVHREAAKTKEYNDIWSREYIERD